MDKKGYEQLVAALAADPNIDAEVHPQPKDGENLKYLTIVLGGFTYHASILNAIERAGLGKQVGFKTYGAIQPPELEIAAASDTQLTFVDKNVR